jgi:hypothetical protein
MPHKTRSLEATRPLELDGCKAVPVPPSHQHTALSRTPTALASRSLLLHLKTVGPKVSVLVFFVPL